MKRRELDGCPITGALQMLGDKWTMLVVREMVSGPKRTMELLNSLFPISSRTLVGRLRDMEKDGFVERTDFGGNPPHIEYALTERGRLLLPLLESLRQLGLVLGCNDCRDRKLRLGSYCEPCPLNGNGIVIPPLPAERPAVSIHRRDKDDSIVLL
ncbi:MAG TPA: helix-turn-helix domain-containing protein [Pyrinomonadaceae bacterium]|jgi:DNA-binding HxlR family transcriptional regulator|nr:helix-turn-helix domain-containing protein [Pyrinomonadaceae bacterium]